MLEPITDMVEKAARAVAAMEFHDYRYSPEGDMLWAREWKWYVDRRGKDRNADCSTQANCERIARAVIQVITQHQRDQ
nr:hypothetical protein 12 [Balneolaceae bacterium]